MQVSINIQTDYLCLLCVTVQREEVPTALPEYGLLNNEMGPMPTYP
jgi:hypothetical protein